MAWVKAEHFSITNIAPFERVVTATSFVESPLPTVTTLSEGASLLSHLRQPLMRKQREQYAGIMEMWPCLHICRLSSLIPATAQNLRCGGKTNLHTEVASDCPRVGASIRVTRDLSRPVSWVIGAEGCKPSAVMFDGGTNRKALRRKRQCGTKLKRRPGMTKRIGKKYKFNKLPKGTVTRRRWTNLRTRTHAKDGSQAKVLKGTMAYAAYLKTDHWQKKRREALHYFGYHCCNCGAEDVKLNVHHTHYDSLWEEEMIDLRVLCNKCHKKVHRR